jgi:hypothetical protein
VSRCLCGLLFCFFYHKGHGGTEKGKELRGAGLRYNVMRRRPEHCPRQKADFLCLGAFVVYCSVFFTTKGTEAQRRERHCGGSGLRYNVQKRKPDHAQDKKGFSVARCLCGLRFFFFITKGTEAQRRERNCGGSGLQYNVQKRRPDHAQDKTGIFCVSVPLWFTVLFFFTTKGREAQRRERNCGGSGLRYNFQKRRSEHCLAFF